MKGLKEGKRGKEENEEGRERGILCSTSSVALGILRIYFLYICHLACVLHHPTLISTFSFNCTTNTDTTTGAPLPPSPPPSPPPHRHDNCPIHHHHHLYPTLATVREQRWTERGASLNDI
jgi:hypothetical protein